MNNTKYFVPYAPFSTQNLYYQPMYPDVIHTKTDYLNVVKKIHGLENFESV